MHITQFNITTSTLCTVRFTQCISQYAQYSVHTALQYVLDLHNLFCYFSFVSYFPNLSLVIVIFSLVIHVQ